ncbi:hypothetical protein CDAR_55391 [Caerostris darwini]|uniref:Uncharacterized protein n=1 Tax=Caerostris darwini TaxID=1538125 RepID=A0AAV4U215_9ARAC|nr:hypothetical protein CDAR_55391 [Caerostris darwini]
MPFWNGKPSVMSHMAAVWLRSVDIATLPTFPSTTAPTLSGLGSPAAWSTDESFVPIYDDQLSKVEAGIRGRREIVNLLSFLFFLFLGGPFPFAIPGTPSPPSKES